MTTDGPVDERDVLPPGWSMSDRGPVSPKGRVYDVIPQGYELADLAFFDSVLDDILRAAPSAFRPVTP